jgi:hypothetical protein
MNKFISPPQNSSSLFPSSYQFMPFIPSSQSINYALLLSSQIINYAFYSFFSNYQYMPFILSSQIINYAFYSFFSIYQLCLLFFLLKLSIMPFYFLLKLSFMPYYFLLKLSITPSILSSQIINILPFIRSSQIINICLIFFFHRFLKPKFSGAISIASR